MEIEKDNKINFLIILINKISRKHDFLIYSKPSNTNITIHNKTLQKPMKKQVKNLKHLKVTEVNFIYNSLTCFGTSTEKLASFLKKHGIHILFNTIHFLDKLINN